MLSERYQKSVFLTVRLMQEYIFHLSNAYKHLFWKDFCCLWSHVIMTGLKLTKQPRRVLNSRYSCFYLPSAGTDYMCAPTCLAIGYLEQKTKKHSNVEAAPQSHQH